MLVYRDIFNDPLNILTHIIIFQPLYVREGSFDAGTIQIVNFTDITKLLCDVQVFLRLFLSPKKLMVNLQIEFCVLMLQRIELDTLSSSANTANHSASSLGIPGTNSGLKGEQCSEYFRWIVAYIYVFNNFFITL